MPNRVSMVLVAMLVAGATGAAAGSRSIADCEMIQAADAYNRCLASFGPAASGGRGRISGVEPSSERDVRSHEYARSHRRGHGSFIEHGRRGRVRMVLTPGRGR